MLKFGALAWRIIGGVCTGFLVGLVGAIFVMFVSDFDLSLIFLNACSLIGAGLGGVIAWQSWNADYKRVSGRQDQAE